MTDIFGRTPQTYTNYAGNTSNLGATTGGFPAEQPGQVTLTNDLVTPRPSDAQLTSMLPGGFGAPTVTTVPPGTTTVPPATTSVPPGMNVTQQNAWAILAQTLQSYGFAGTDLQGLEDFVQKELINGTGADQINLDLQQTKEFANRFPAIVARRNAGLPPVSPAEYVSLERNYAQLERAAGLPPNFTDQSHYDTLIANDVSPSEYSGRIQQGYVAMLQAPPEATQALQDYYGITSGALAAHFLDPTLAAPILAQQAQSAIIGAAGMRSGFGEPTQAQAMRLAQLGVTDQAAQAGFADLAHQSQLTGTLPGQSQQAISADQLLGGEFGGDQATKDLLVQRAAQQKAAFSQNTAFGTTQTGVTGLGTVVR